MKIYSNPNFPRIRPEQAARRDQIDTLTFVSELQARNAKALEQLCAQGLRRAPCGRAKAVAPRTQHKHQVTGRVLTGDAHNHRFSGLTGPPIKIPGGHVHAIQGTTELGRKRNGER